MVESDIIPKTEMDSEEYESGRAVPKGSMGNFGIPKAEMDIEESDTGSYTPSSSMEGEEMKNNFDDLYSKHYLSDEEYDIENHPMCFCGRLAKQRMSMTSKNPGRWFFNCAKKNFDTQCGFFLWCDELYEDGDGDEGENGDEEDEYESDESEVDSNHLEFEEMVLSEDTSTLSYQASPILKQLDQVKEINFFPQYPDLALIVQDHKPEIGLDGSTLSLAPPGALLV